MNEIKIVFMGLIALVISALLLWVFEAPEIIEDKEVEIATALGIGLLILVLDKRSVHEKIHQQPQVTIEDIPVEYRNDSKILTFISAFSSFQEEKKVLILKIQEETSIHLAIIDIVE